MILCLLYCIRRTVSDIALVFKSRAAGIAQVKRNTPSNALLWKKILSGLKQLLM